jgi:hypothetical protein
MTHSHVAERVGLLASYLLMRGRMRSLALVCFLSLLGGTAGAQTVDPATRGAARTLGNDGVKAYQANDYATASEKFEKAYSLLRAPSLGLWSARALAKLGKFVEASERYLEVTRLTVSGGDEAVQKQAQADARTELDALVPRIPSIVIAIEGATPSEVTVNLQGVDVATELVGERRPANPGHVVVIGRRGQEEVRAEADLSEGEQKTLRLAFAPIRPGAGTAAATQTSAPPASEYKGKPGSTQRLLGWISIGVGGAGLAVGGVFGSMAMGTQSDLDDSGDCVDQKCEPSQQDNVDKLGTQRTISTVGFIAGGVLAATGIVLVFTAPKGDTRPQASLRVSPGGFVFERAF